MTQALAARRPWVEYQYFAMHAANILNLAHSRRMANILYILVMANILNLAHGCRVANILYILELANILNMAHGRRVASHFEIIIQE